MINKLYCKLRRYITGILAAALMIAGMPVSARAEDVAKVRIAVAATSAGSEQKSLESYGVILEVVHADSDVSEYDGLLIPGGTDITPAFYGEAMAGSKDCDKKLDAEQLEILGKFVEAKKPILGICRGMQLINVYFGGTLNQNITGHIQTKSVITMPNSILRTLCGATASVSCGHHQSVKKLGSDLVVTMRSSDGSPEGFEHQYLPILAIQWHPDHNAVNSIDQKVLRYFAQNMCGQKAYDRTSYVRNNDSWYLCKNGERECLAENSVVYQTHVQTYGWLEYAANGEPSGTSGESKRMEAIRIELANADIGNSGITYQTHVQTYGWKSWVNDGALSGTSGEGKRMEAIRIKLTGDIAQTHDVYYRVHAQHYGWLGWAKNGQAAGTAGYAYRLEAVEVKVVEKGCSDAPVQDSKNMAFRNAAGHTHEFLPERTIEGTCTEMAAEEYSCYCGYRETRVSQSAPGHMGEVIEYTEPTCTEPGAYEMKCSVCGEEYSESADALGHNWIETEQDEEKIYYTCERCGESRAENILAPVSVTYKTHVQKKGWLTWVKDGETSGTSGEALRMESIQIKLEGMESVTGGIRYNTHVQKKGWMGWVSDGAIGGTVGQALRMEAIRIELTGDIAEYYDVYYCVHAQTYGWLNWAKNGEEAGTSGLAKRLEAIRIVLVPKDGEKPDAVGTHNRAYIKG